MTITRECVGLLLNYRDAVRSIRCIHSLLEQPCAGVVVWDNSEDEGCSATMIDAAFAHDQRVVIEVSAANLGFAAGVNRGLQVCMKMQPKAWVLLINSDARLLPGGLAKLATALGAQATAQLAFPNIDHAGTVRGWGYYHRRSGLLAWRPRRGYFCYASGCCLLLAMDRMALPLFDEDFFMYGEDCELGWRLGRQLDAIVHLDETLVQHEGSASSGLGSAFYESHMVAAHLLLARKLAKNLLDIWLLHALRGVMLIVRAGVRTLRFRSLIPLKALWVGARLAFGKR